VHDVTVQCPHHANARHHRRSVIVDDQEQGFDGGLLAQENAFFTRSNMRGVTGSCSSPNAAISRRGRSLRFETKSSNRITQAARE
jgi:hypothetical protein